METRTKKMAIVGMLCAISFLSVLFIRFPLIPAAPFLEYEPKTIFITIGGMIWGPIVALIASVIVPFIEMIGASSTGIIGFLFNVISTMLFCCIPAVIYRKKKTLKSAVTGLLLAVVLTTAVMILWNYAITPIYMGVPRKVIVEMIPTVFIPFNLIKYGLNFGFILLLYKPVVNRLRKLNGWVPTSDKEAKHGLSVGVVITSVVLIAICISVIIYLKSLN